MRAELDQARLSVAPGAAAEVGVEVFNAADVIDGVTARVIGLDPAWVRARPPQLALFPDTSGTIALHLDVPPEFPAGEHELSVELSSSVDPSATTYVPLGLSVAPTDLVELRLQPSVAGGRRRGHYEVVTENVGNTEVELVLTGADADRALQFTFEPPVIRLPPSTMVLSGIDVVGRRRWFGQPLSRPIEVTASSRALELRAIGSFEHQPMVPRGVLTALLLATIVGLWAAVFLFGLAAIMAGDELPKSAPASLFATSPAILEAGGGPGEEGAGGGGGAAKVDARAVGATVAGTVTAASTEAGVGRISVEAIRQTATGPVLVTATATGDDGSYELERLVPGTYHLRFSAPGFEELWYPAAPTEAGAEEVALDAKQAADGFDVVVEGMIGSIAGVVDTGDAEAPVVVAVAVRPVVEGVPGEVTTGAASAPDGGFAVAGLATPGTYELTFTAPGYQTTTTVEALDGGEALLTNPVRLSAGDGAISGLVTDGTDPIGGVVVLATAGALELTSATPTAGAVGRFALSGLPTPGTYLLTFSRDGFGSETVAVDLGPGESLAAADVTLVAGTGSISGTVTDTAGRTLGDVDVVVNGGATQVRTTTLTAGGVGSYVLSGLPTPGNYTVTFTSDGFESQTVGVSLLENGAARGVDAALAPNLGVLRGTVVGADGQPIAGATITATDGATARQGISASQPPGSWVIVGVPAGAYAVTAESGFARVTRLVTIAAGEDLIVDLRFPGPGG